MKKTADVVIIGGGCMGASVAYHLARLGLNDVVLIERELLLGMGSTGRNAGGVRHQFSSEANVRLSIESIHLFERFADEVGYEIDFHQHGYLFLLSLEDNVQAFRRNVEMQRRLGVEVELLTPNEAQRLAHGLEVDGVIAATYCSRDGIADPNGVTMGFARAAQAAGIEIYWDTEVTGIELEGDRINAVETTKGKIATRKIVNAAGPHARQIGQMARVDVPVLPYRRHIFITEQIVEQQRNSGVKTGVPDSRIMVIDFESTFYFHREGGGILFGMSDADEPPSFNTTVSWEFLERVIPIAVKRLPLLAETAIAHAWAGLYEVTPDAMPIIGEVAELDGFFIIGGFSGHGFQHSPAAGRILATMIAGEAVVDIDASAFALDRFKHPDRDHESSVV